jgi:hypothetical protein
MGSGLERSQWADLIPYEGELKPFEVWDSLNKDTQLALVKSGLLDPFRLSRETCLKL